MEDVYLNVTLAALQDRETGIKTFAKKSVLSKKVKLCFYGAQIAETMRTFGIDDKVKALEIGQRLFDAGFILPFDAKDKSQILHEGCVYFWSDLVVMESKIIETHFNKALNYFLEHPYGRCPSTTASSSSVDETLSKSSTGLLKRLRGLVDEQSAAPAPVSVAPAVNARRNSQRGLSPTRQSAQTPTSTSSASSLASAQEVPGPDTVEEDTDEIKFFLSPEDPHPVVKAATLDKLIERLTYEAYIDMRFRHQFLITYRSFTTPMVLLEKLRERFNSMPAVPPRDSTDRLEWERQRKLIHLRVLTVLSRWITDLYEDWNDSELRNALSLLLNEAPSNVAPLCNQIRVLLTKSQNDRCPVEPPASGPATFSFDDAAIPDLAQQLTAYEYQLFSLINRDEFLGLKWSKPGKNERAKSIIRYITHFNRVSNWVVREIVTCFQLNKRSKLVLKFVQLAFKFREYNNFSSSMCILAALVSSPVRRLKATWAEVPSEWQEKMASLETLFAHNMSYKAYRETVQKQPPPCIPYLGLYLTDLTFIEEANEDKLGDLINFQKRIMISKVIEDIRRFQTVPYKNFTLTNAVKNWLQSLPVLSNDEEAYQLSLKIEPRNAAVTLESMLVEEDRLRKLLHEREIRISDLESENQRLKQQLALLDAGLRTQIRRGSVVSDEVPPIVDINDPPWSGTRDRSAPIERSRLNSPPSENTNPNASCGGALESQLPGKLQLTIERAAPISEGERLSESGERPLTESGERPLSESGEGPLHRSSRSEAAASTSPPSATSVTHDSHISPTRASSPHGASAGPAATPTTDDAAPLATPLPPVPTRRAPLAASANTLVSSPSSTDEEPAQPERAKGLSASDSLLVGSAASPYERELQTESTSPREPQTPSPYPGFDLPAPDMAPPPPPPPVGEGHPASPARGPSDAELEADGSQSRGSNGAASTHPGERFGRIGMRRADSPTLGPDVYAAKGSQSQVPYGSQASPARIGVRLPASPSSRRIPSSPAPQLPRHSARTGPPATTQAP